MTQAVWIPLIRFALTTGPKTLDALTVVCMGNRRAVVKKCHIMKAKGEIQRIDDGGRPIWALTMDKRDD